MTDFEKLVTALLNGETVTITPNTDFERYMLACINGTGTDGLPVPNSVMDILLYQLVEKMAGSVSGGGDYKLQIKTITPEKTQISVTSDSGYYGLKSITVLPIPDIYQDVSPVTAGANDVLVNKTIVNASGIAVPGAMPNNGSVAETVDTVKGEYTIPKGYHSGSGKVTVKSGTKSVTPSTSQQLVFGDNNAYLTSVTISAIPSKYKDVSGVTTTADKVLAGSEYIDADGTLTQGAMTNQGSHKATMDGISTTSMSIPKGYHDGTGSISLTNDIVEALAAI